MNTYLKFGVLAITPLGAISIPYLSGGTSLKQPEVTKEVQNNPAVLDESVMLIIKKQLDLWAPCELTVNGPGLKEVNKKLFKDGKKLLNYLIKGRKKLISENWQISFPKKIFQEPKKEDPELKPLTSTQNKQIIAFQNTTKGKNENFQKLWKQWTSYWDSKSPRISKIIFGIEEDEDSLGSIPTIKQLHKCYNGNWYSVIFNSDFSLEEIENIDFKHWINNHLGLL